MQTLVILSEIDLEKKTGASWNRILCYSKGISDAGAKVIITSAKYKYTNISQLEKLDGNIYLVISKTIRYSTKKAIPILNEINFLKNLGYLREITNVLKITSDSSRYLLYPSNLSLSFVSLFYLKLYKNKIVFVEKNELNLAKALNFPVPASFVNKLFFPLVWTINLILGVLTDISHIFFDGMIFISTRMEHLYKKFNKNSIRIPILTDSNNNVPDLRRELNRVVFSIAYTGNIAEKRDGVFSFLESIPLLININSKIEVNLYGSITNSGKDRLDSMINKYQLSAVVRYHGNKPAEEIPEIFKLQDLLILPRPLNIQTNYGFSTKLAEYLSSGVPVLSTKTSDTEMFLTNNKNIYFLDSLKPKDIASKLTEVIKNRSLHIAIAKEAKKVQMKYFYYKNYSRVLFNFFFYTR